MTRILDFCIPFTMSLSVCDTEQFCVFGCVEIHFKRHSTATNKQVHDTYMYAELISIGISSMHNSA